MDEVKMNIKEVYVVFDPHETFMPEFINISIEGNEFYFKKEDADKKASELNKDIIFPTEFYIVSTLEEFINIFGEKEYNYGMDVGSYDS